MTSIAVFNNKGGVGKTTYLYHLSNLIADKGKTVLMVDCDSQCNLTSYTLEDTEIESAWSKDGNSIYRIIEPILKGLGDFKKIEPTNVKRLNENLYIVPGDMDLSIFEDRLSETWSSASNQEISLRTQVAIYRYAMYAAKKIGAEFILFDLGPNLGALNRSVLAGCDYFITPMSPDLFSIKGTQNLGAKFVTWHEEWEPILNKWKPKNLFELPNATPKFLGYVIQKYNLRNGNVTKGWSIFVKKIDESVRDNIVNKLSLLNQVMKREDENYSLGSIPNLHSLIPYSLDAKKPIYKCNGSDGLRGSHINRAEESCKDYESVLSIILNIK